MNSIQRRWLAFHEAGHAVAAVVLGVEVAWADLNAGPGYGGVLYRRVNPGTDAVVAMAGYVAGGGLLAYGPSTHDTRAAVALVGEDGMATAEAAAREVLAANQPAALAVADALYRQERLTGGQIWALVRSTAGVR